MAQARRDAEFTEFVAARRTHLRRIAYAICGDWHQADDLLQIALTKLYRAWPRVRRDGREEAYARRIIVRASLDEDRRPWRRERAGLDGHDAPAPAGLAVEDRSAPVEALQALPLMQRKTVLLRHWLGLSVEETADELGIAAGPSRATPHAPSTPCSRPWPDTTPEDPRRPHPHCAHRLSTPTSSTGSKGPGSTGHLLPASDAPHRVTFLARGCYFVRH